MMIPLAFEDESERAMTSILTNISAMSALQTLRAVSTSLGETQGRVSSGLRVGTASDNAAYWSIATTMRSDNMALSSVEDALGLGAAKVDTAYAGMTAVVDVLKEFKAKVVAAHEEGLDKNKIQEELEQLKQQIVSVTDSASFGGQNWLSGAGTAGNNSVVSSFVRDGSGNVGVKKVEVPRSATTLFAVDGTGILDGGVAPDPGRLAVVDDEVGGFSPYVRFNFSGPLVFADDTTYISFGFNGSADDPEYVTNPHPGVTTKVVIDRTLVDSVLPAAGGVISTREEMSAVLSAALVPARGFSWNPSEGGYAIQSDNDDDPRQSVIISNLVSTLPSSMSGGLTAVQHFSTPPMGYDDAFDEWNGLIDTADFFPMSIPDGEVNFTLQFGHYGWTGEVMKSNSVIRINEGTIKRSLGIDDGVIMNSEELAKVLETAFLDSGQKVAVEYDTYADGNSFLYLRASPEQYFDTGGMAFMRFKFVSATPNPGILDIDVTDSGRSMDSNIYHLEGMIEKTISAAATLGALQSRIDMQTEFASTLSDSIDSGVGRLVDADMNEESTRLKALQTQEQLAIQALSIANTSAEAIMQLFR